jgi:hypothetical protein
MVIENNDLAFDVELLFQRLDSGLQPRVIQRSYPALLCVSDLAAEVLKCGEDEINFPLNGVYFFSNARNCSCEAAARLSIVIFFGAICIQA